MSAPRLEIDLEKIFHNARTLVQSLGNRGISVTGVTKAALGSADIATTMLRAGVNGLGDSRIENLAALRSAGVSAPLALIRSPMISRADEVVQTADLSLNSELDVMRELSLAARHAGKIHGVVLMVELGDLREGILPEDLLQVVQETLRLPNISFEGIGSNLACRSGAAPSAENMSELSALADSIETTLGVAVGVVSGGNSANLEWALNAAGVGRINNLRLGESILLGRETLHRRPIDGLHTDAITLVAEVIESKRKPTRPRGEIAQTAFGEAPPALDRGSIQQIILAIGIQDTDPAGLTPPDGIEILAASSDHLIVESHLEHVSVGAEMRFQLDYGALVRAMTSPFVVGVVTSDTVRPESINPHRGSENGADRAATGARDSSNRQ